MSPDTEPEDDAEAEATRPVPAAEGIGAAQTAAPTGAMHPLSLQRCAPPSAAMPQRPCGTALCVLAACR